MAEAATGALRALLGEGDVTIFNIGPDKYAGRVVADVATRRTGNVSTAMLARRSCPQLRRRSSQRLVRECGPTIAQMKKPRDRAAFRIQSNSCDQRVTVTVVPTETR